MSEWQGLIRLYYPSELHFNYWPTLSAVVFPILLDLYLEILVKILVATNKKVLQVRILVDFFKFSVLIRSAKKQIWLKHFFGSEQLNMCFFLAAFGGCLKILVITRTHVVVVGIREQKFMHVLSN